jgi:MFS family permease
MSSDPNDIVPTEAGQAEPPIEPRRWLVLAVMSVGTLMVFLDDTVVNTAVPQISVDLDASASALQWVIDAYVLVLAGLLLLCAPCRASVPRWCCRRRCRSSSASSRAGSGRRRSPCGPRSAAWASPSDLSSVAR